MRTQVELTVSRRDGRPGLWRSVDFSEGGCFLANGPLLARDEQLDVGFSVGDREVVARARVVWINTPGGLAKRLPPGMGVQFVALDDAGRSTLRDHLERVQRAQTEVGPFESVLPPLPPGTMLAAEYRVVKCLGRGRTTSVYECEHTPSRQRVAVKLLRDELAKDTRLVGAFIKEAERLKALKHPNVAVIGKISGDGARKFYVTELLEGPTLADATRHGCLPLASALDVARQLSRAFAEAHDRRIRLGRMTPENIFLVERGGRRDVVKLYKLGKTTDKDDKNHPRADIYDFGLLMYQLFSGRNHRGDRRPDPLPKDLELPETLAALVMACFEPKPPARPRDMHMIAHTLDAIAGQIWRELLGLRPIAPKKKRSIAPLLVVLAFVGVVAGARLARDPVRHAIAAGHVRVYRATAAALLRLGRPDLACRALTAKGPLVPNESALAQVRAELGVCDPVRQ